MGLEMEDDVLYADIKKQIALLIMDDDEDDVVVFPVQTPPPFHQQQFHHRPQSMITPPYTHEMPYSYRRRECKGTGVFIPRSSPPLTRKNKRPANKKKNKVQFYHQQQPTDELGSTNS